MNDLSEPGTASFGAGPASARATGVFGGAGAKTLSLIGLAWLAVALLYMVPYLVSSRDRLSVEAIVAHLLVAFVGMAFSILLLAAVTRTVGQTGYRAFAKSSAAVIAASAATSTIDLYVFRWTYSIFKQDWSAPYLVNWTSNFAVFMSQYSLIAIIFWLLKSFEAQRRNAAELQDAQLKAAKSEIAENEALLVALRYQINPHFLFNTLNSISSLVVTNRAAQAEEMIGQLSDFLRVTLTDDAQAPQTLDHELETIEAYLNIEGVRFGDRLAIAIDCPDALRGAHFPTFILQPLVENAIKYGVAGSRRTVTVAIRARREGDCLIVAVEDDGDAAGDAAAGHGIGLTNVRRRLSALYGAAARLETAKRASGFASIVRLPFRAA